MNQTPAGTLQVVGLASGTPTDGIDAALVRVTGTGAGARVQLEAHRRYPYPPGIRDDLLRTFGPAEGQTGRLSALSFILGELFAAAAIDLVKTSGIRMSHVDLIGSQGQTVWHSPDAAEIGEFWAVSTLQIGEPAVVAERTGVTVVADFGSADMAAGGQGAPLVPYADLILFKSPNRSRAVQSIGAAGSVTYIPAGGGMDQVISFDTGPGVMLIDAVVSRLTGGTLTYDAGGSLAMSGRPDKVVLGQLMSHPFLEKRPPKSVGRGEFGMEFADEILARYPDLSLEDMVATVTAFVVRSISRSCGRWLPGTVDDIIVGGGGARNPALMKMISDAFPRAKLYTCEDFGIGNDAKDALAFGLLASETMHMQPGNVPSATGAKRRVVLGKIAPGRNYQALVDRIAGREERGSK